MPLSDTTIREKLLTLLNERNWGQHYPACLNVTVNGGVVDLWGFIESDTERKAIRVAAEATAGVRARERSHDSAADWLLICLTWMNIRIASNPIRCHVAVLKYWYP